MGSPITHQKSDFPRKLEEPLLTSKLSPPLMSRACPAAPHAGPDLFTWYWTDGRTDATLQSHQMKASEPINRAILQTVFKITIALYCSNQYAQYMLNVYEYTLLFLFFENVRSIFSFSFLLNLKKKA